MLNKGMKAHHHGMNAMSLLYHHYWNAELLPQIKEELKKSVELMEDHLSQFKCKCGDTEEEIKFYKELLIQIERAIVENDWLGVPWVQERLHAYVNRQKGKHSCMTHLLKTRHEWIAEEQI